ncbi:MAG: polyprenyl synthetase family protein [Arenimonas sp.]
MAAEIRAADDSARIESALDAALPTADAIPGRLHAAMRHAVLGGGKRLRARLVLAAGALGDADPRALDAAAVAVELIHAFSLVHDDLPAMDDDILRRGRPTVHVAFDEATAILAGDALQALAFEVLADAPADALMRVQLVSVLARATGAAGMCGGQQLDMDATGRALPLDALQALHARKTGALIVASVRLGATLAGLDAARLAQLDAFAADLGLAFQIRDDILDVEADTAALGKTAGKDATQGKATYPALLGLDGATARLAALAETMRAALAFQDQGPLDGKADALRALAGFTVTRGG